MVSEKGINDDEPVVWSINLAEACLDLDADADGNIFDV